MPRSRARSARSTARSILCNRAEVAGAGGARPDPLAYITQTTLSVDDTRGIIAALKARFPAIVGPDVRDICYATQNRQEAVRDLAELVDLILVVGSQEQLQLQPPARDRRGAGQPELSDRRRRALDPPGSTACARRPDRRRLGAGSPGAGRDRRLAPVRPISVEPLDGVAGRREVQAAGRTRRRLRRSPRCGCAYPNQACKVGAYVAQAAPHGPQALPAGADAGAAVPLQPGLRRLRQDRLPGGNPEPAPQRRRVPGGGRRMRRAGGGHRRRRAAAAQGDAEDRRRDPARKKFVILCTNALLLEKKIDQYKPNQISAGRSTSTATRRCTTARCARTASTSAPSPPSSWPSPRASASSSTAPCSTTPTRSASPRFFDDVMAIGHRRHQRLPRLRL